MEALAFLLQAFRPKPVVQPPILTHGRPPKKTSNFPNFCTLGRLHWRSQNEVLKGSVETDVHGGQPGGRAAIQLNAVKLCHRNEWPDRNWVDALEPSDAPAV